MAFNSIAPSREETLSVGPNRGRQIQEKYDALNAEIEKQIAQANEARRMSGLSGELSSAEEQKIADQVTSAFRSKEAGRVGPPGPESLAAAVSSRKREEVGPPSSAASPRISKDSESLEKNSETALVPQDTTLMDTVKKSWMTPAPEYPGPAQSIIESPVAAEIEKPSTLKQAVQQTVQKPLPANQVPYAPDSQVPPPPTEKEPKKVFGVTAPEAPKPTDLKKILNTFESKIEKSQAGVKSAMNTQLSELKDLETVYRNEAKASKDQLAKQELAENMGHALAQFGAGLNGLNTGIDMSSGLKFNKTDWNKRYEQAIEELKANLTDLREKRGEVKAMGLEGMKEAERRGERGMTLVAGELARKEAAESAAGLETRKETFQTKEKEADRKSREAIAGIQSSARLAAANQKLTDKQTKEVETATNNFLQEYETMQTSNDKTQKQLATKNFMKYEQIINAHLGDNGKTVAAIKAKLKDVPFFSTESGYLEEQIPEQAEVLQKAVAGRAPAKAAVPGVAAGQAPAASDTIQVRDSVQGSPTFGQTKAVKNSDKVQQLIREGKLQAVQ